MTAPWPAAAAVKAGKHVLVEKPMATTLSEAQRLLQVSRQAAGSGLCTACGAVAHLSGAASRDSMRARSAGWRRPVCVMAGRARREYWFDRAWWEAPVYLGV